MAGVAPGVGEALHRDDVGEAAMVEVFFLAFAGGELEFKSDDGFEFGDVEAPAFYGGGLGEGVPDGCGRCIYHTLDHEGFGVAGQVFLETVEAEIHTHLVAAEEAT